MRIRIGDEQVVVDGSTASELRAGTVIAENVAPDEGDGQISTVDGYVSIETVGIKTGDIDIMVEHTWPSIRDGRVPAIMVEEIFLQGYGRSPNQHTR